MPTFSFRITIDSRVFLFDYGCCNRIIWGPDQYTKVRIRDELLHYVAVRRQAGRKDLPVPRAHHDGAAIAGELVGEICDGPGCLDSLRGGIS
jgi:hypothetical protein